MVPTSTARVCLIEIPGLSIDDVLLGLMAERSGGSVIVRAIAGGLMHQIEPVVDSTFVSGGIFTMVAMPSRAPFADERRAVDALLVIDASPALH